MYNELDDADLQAWLLSDSISDDAVLASDDEWSAAQSFRNEVRDIVYVRQCLYDEPLEVF